MANRSDQITAINGILKYKEVSTTTSASEGGVVNVAHGLTGADIRTLNAKVTTATNYGILPANTTSAEHEYDIFHNATNIVITNKTDVSGQILSKAITISIGYV